jgi:hypothetical protein
MLHELEGEAKGLHKWCGPSAIAIVAGITYADAVLVLRYVSPAGKRIMGTSSRQVKAAFDRLGWIMQSSRSFENTEAPTLASWLRDRRDYQMDKTFIVIVGQSDRHWIVVKGRKTADNWSGGPVWLSESPHRRKRVIDIFQLTEKRDADPKRVLADLRAQEDRHNAERRHLRKILNHSKNAAMALIKKLGCKVTFEDDLGRITVDAPPGMLFYASGTVSEYYTETGSGDGWAAVVRDLNGKNLNELFETDPDAEEEA